MTSTEPVAFRREASIFIVLSLLGAAFWAMIFGLPPRVPRDVADWPKEVRYYSVLKEAVTIGAVPYYVSRPLQDTRKFLAIPEIVVSPQVVLLRFMDIDAFLLVHVVLLQTIGTAGCLWLRRRHGLSLAPTLLLWLLLSFNGHVTAHLAIGHSMWGGCFFLPWFFAGVLELVDGTVDRRWPLAVGFVLAAMLLQGSYHVFVWCVLLLLLLLLSQPQRLPVAAALAWSAALGLVRLIPAAVILLGRRDQSFQTGYASLGDVLAGLVLIRDVTFPRRGGGSMGGLNWWEFDVYVGVAGAVWLLVSSGFCLVRRPHLRLRLGLPLAVMAVLSLGQVYAPLSWLGVPLLAAERVSSRLLVIPVGLLAVVAAVGAEAWSRRGPRRVWLTWLVTAATAASLLAHSRAWTLARIEDLSPPPARERDLEIHIVPPETEGPKDALYVGSVRGSAAASAAALLLLVWRWRRAAVSR